ncbi:hypothetical protein TREMEDRAFT_65789 [Tremella mesenterica DSM 1558]|uniref:uncharacterized protein n=1 Tax=Tremella mesenterica (strain ATCC 24925 / CBS 8224 / DSM 1558 / NBRC 9311 / NRRL Y-6157 / RJB 2259-6 / UBC 559-6) TaxID=578456 RepID=UPI00032BB5BD|nr:uncharacterized protein TREMEDRAFT_65789 [Tremella mesenterica DSM 1558]EIW66185.1 hypothetical protein TREMEDRAFT_65789 [Tremella mesenterica DSM 1558]
MNPEVDWKITDNEAASIASTSTHPDFHADDTEGLLQPSQKLQHNWFVDWTRSLFPSVKKPTFNSESGNPTITVTTSAMEMTPVSEVMSSRVNIPVDEITSPTDTPGSPDVPVSRARRLRRKVWNPDCQVYTCLLGTLTVIVVGSTVGWVWGTQRSHRHWDNRKKTFVCALTDMYKVHEELQSGHGGAIIQSSPYCAVPGETYSVDTVQSGPSYAKWIWPHRLNFHDKYVVHMDTSINDLRAAGFYTIKHKYDRNAAFATNISVRLPDDLFWGYMSRTTS